MQRRRWWATGLAIVLALVVACSSESKVEPGATTPKGEKYTNDTGKKQVAIDAVDNMYQAQYIEVSKGTKITFTNDGRNRHNVLPDEEGVFDAIEVDAFEPGTADVRTFDKPGEYGYYCSLHGAPGKGMYGVIRVVG